MSGCPQGACVPPKEQPRERRPRGGKKHRKPFQKDAAKGASALVGAKAEETTDPLHDFRTISTEALLTILRERRHEDAQKSKKTQPNTGKGHHSGGPRSKENKPPQEARQALTKRRYEGPPRRTSSYWGRGERPRGWRNPREGDRPPYHGLVSGNRDGGGGSGGSIARTTTQA